MKPIQVSTSASAGGAARAANRLHTGLRRCGIDSRLYVLTSDHDSEEVQAFQFDRRLTSRAYRILRRHWIEPIGVSETSSPQKGHEPFTIPNSALGIQFVQQIPDCDLLNLHWISHFADIPLLFRHVNKPIVWTLHDMNPFTGGCHYDEGCGKFEHACGNCPQLNLTAENDVSRRIWTQKKEAYQRRPPASFHVVSPSRWLAREARRSSLLRDVPIHVIPYGLDTGLFRPLPRCVARLALGLPETAKLVLFVAEKTNNPRKGFSILTEVLTNVEFAGDVVLLSIGTETPNISGVTQHLHLGAIHDELLLAQIYSAADVFAIPSLQDNLPNTVLEAIACGTPIVGFDAGGIPDMVRHGQNGLLVPTGNGVALAEALRFLLGNESLRGQLATGAREIALNEYRLELQAERYASLYSQILAASSLQE